MWWRITRREFVRQQGEGNRRAMKQIVDSGMVPGLLAYEGDTPIGWVSVAPREDFASLNRSPNLRPVDDKPVWSIVCFYVDPEHRGKGVLSKLVAAARDYALSQGAQIVEAYPREPGRRLSSELAYMGLVPAFKEAGFVEVLHRSPARPILRYQM
jgi:GNAT superfamily N-acetyltransferase